MFSPQHEPACQHRRLYREQWRRVRQIVLKIRECSSATGIDSWRFTVWAWRDMPRTLLSRRWVSPRTREPKTRHSLLIGRQKNNFTKRPFVLSKPCGKSEVLLRILAESLLNGPEVGPFASATRNRGVEVLVRPYIQPLRPLTLQVPVDAATMGRPISQLTCHSEAQPRLRSSRCQFHGACRRGEECSNHPSVHLPSAGEVAALPRRQSSHRAETDFSAQPGVPQSSLASTVCALILFAKARQAVC